MFELESSLTRCSGETPCSDELRSGEPKIGGTITQIMDMRPKIVLPRRPGEPRLAPPQYYYPASRTGVMPAGYATGSAAHLSRLRRITDG
jgi:hypothetical protein